MRESELETKRKVIYNDNTKRIDELEKWFMFEYPIRLNKIARYTYLGIKGNETRYALEIEAYDKENELRLLRGEELLPPLKLKDLF